MLFTTRRAASTAMDTALSTITTACDIVNTSLLAIDKGIFWCSSKIDENMSDVAKTAWVEHEAHLHGFSSADKWKKYNDAMAAKAIAEEDVEISNLSKGEVKKEKTKTTKSGS